MIGRWPQSGNRSLRPGVKPSVTSTTRALAICSLFAGASCSSQSDVTTTSAITVPTTFAASTPVELVPQIIATTVPEVTATAPPGLQLLSASYGCGPADGPWVEAAVFSSVRRTVLGQIWLGSKPYGQSDLILVQPGMKATIGFDPATPSEAFGSIAVIRIVASEDLRSPLATGDVLLKVAPGVGCG